MDSTIDQDAIRGMLHSALSGEELAIDPLRYSDLNHHRLSQIEKGACLHLFNWTNDQSLHLSSPHHAEYGRRRLERYLLAIETVQEGVSYRPSC